MILAIDPGEINFAYSLLDMNTYELKDTGLVKNTITDLTKGKVQLYLTLYVEEISKILKRTKIKNNDFVIIERWIPRQSRKGTMPETINMMIGSLFTMCPCDFDLVAASTWKNWFNRNYKNKKQTIFDLIQNDFLTDHQADSIGIAAWYLEWELKIENAWKNILESSKKYGY